MAEALPLRPLVLNMTPWELRRWKAAKSNLDWGPPHDQFLGELRRVLGDEVNELEPRLRAATGVTISERLDCQTIPCEGIPRLVDNPGDTG